MRFVFGTILFIVEGSSFTPEQFAENFAAETAASRAQREKRLEVERKFAEFPNPPVLAPVWANTEDDDDKDDDDVYNILVGQGAIERDDFAVVTAMGFRDQLTNKLMDVTYETMSNFGYVTMDMTPDAVWALVKPILDTVVASSDKLKEALMRRITSVSSEKNVSTLHPPQVREVPVIPIIPEEKVSITHSPREGPVDDSLDIFLKNMHRPSTPIPQDYPEDLLEIEDPNDLVHLPRVAFKPSSKDIFRGVSPTGVADVHEHNSAYEAGLLAHIKAITKQIKKKGSTPELAKLLKLFQARYLEAQLG